MEQLIDQLYQTFAKYRRPKSFPACQCCLSDEEKSLLLNCNLPELKRDVLGSYAADVFFTVGSLPDFKYFLPRIFELCVQEEFSWPDPEVVLGKLPLADWESWPEDERDAILRLINRKYEAVLKAPVTDGSDVDEWMCALGRCVLDVTPYLNQMLEETYEEKLISFVEWNLSAFTEIKLTNAFWETGSFNEQRVLEWLNQPRVKAILTERYGIRF